MAKRLTVMSGMVLIGLGVGIAVGYLPANPGAQAAVAAIGGLLMWLLVKVLSRNGEIWKFKAPYP